MAINPTLAEIRQRDEVLTSILGAIEEGVTIRLPPFDPELSQASPGFALQSVGIEPNAYGGTVGPFRYQFEGEEDLLHLIVTRLDGAVLSPEEGQGVARFLLPNVEPGLVWLKPGTVTQHFYVGHDDLVEDQVI
jgi:hypothetical protein